MMNIQEAMAAMKILEGYFNAYKEAIEAEDKLVDCHGDTDESLFNLQRKAFNELVESFHYAGDCYNVHTVC